MHQTIKKLNHLFHQWSGNIPDKVIVLPTAGSARKYFRLSFAGISAIGAWNPVVEENEAFIAFSQHFFNCGLHVPEIYRIDKEKQAYLIEDLGNTSLFSMVEKKAPGDAFPEEIIDLYRKSLEELIRFQIVAGKDLEYNFCYPHSSFDGRSILWDLNYFKYYFLRLHLPFHEGRLEDEFEKLAGFLGQSKGDYFMYRDFQARNILIRNSQPYFIDYQGGRKGPLQYDVASLLFQVKADLPFSLREELLDYYIDSLYSYGIVDKENFKKHYYGFVLIRLLQVLGAYGYRGLIEKKPHFLSSIPFALKNVRWWLDHIDLPVSFPELHAALESLTGLEQYHSEKDKARQDKLTISLKSFSYKNGIPDDLTGNGGGFVFDCRALPNPGREEQYRAFNGKDKVIIDYLKNEPDVVSFISEAVKMVEITVKNYLDRGFSNLSVSFGCTGGQHRSVYCTESLAAWLGRNYPEVVVNVDHIMLKI